MQKFKILLKKFLKFLNLINIKLLNKLNYYIISNKKNF